MCFAGSEDDIKISMREEDPSSDEIMRWLLRILLYSLDLLLRDMIAPKLLNEFVVVDLLVGAAGNRIGIDHEILLFYLHLFHHLFLDFLLNFCLGFSLNLLHQLKILILFNFFYKISKSRILYHAVGQRCDQKLGKDNLHRKFVEMHVEVDVIMAI